MLTGLLTEVKKKKKSVAAKVLRHTFKKLVILEHAYS
jgi:hypothetical protein